jgi:hypothetical protein
MKQVRQVKKPTTPVA